MLKPSVIRKSTNPTAKRAWKWRLPTGASPISAAMVAVMGLTGWKNDLGIAAAPPAAIKTVIVSPMALPKPKITAVAIPGRALFTTTAHSVSHLVAPSAKEASLNSKGTALTAS